MAKPCLCYEGDLPNETVLSLLMNRNDDSVCHLPPINPKGGEVYLFSPKESTKAKGTL